MQNDLLAVEVHGLVRRFGSAVAVDGLDLNVERGECLGLLGPNGAGKSTTVRILSSLLAPCEGSVRILGLDPERQGGELRARLGVVPQEIALYGHLSGRENLRFFGSLFDLGGGQLAEAVEKGLKLAGLEERAGGRVDSYSGGMKRRLNVAAALLHGPELVLLDEPTVGIDPQSRNRIYEMVERMKQDGTTLIYTSHQLGEVERLCDRIVILDRGKKMAEGTLAELQRHPDVKRPGGSLLRFTSGDAARRVAESLASESISFELREELPSLEQVFLDLTGHALRDEVSP